MRRVAHIFIICYPAVNNRLDARIHTTLAYTMKVLMFGWEFPPHISGGLGTACAGLTRALVKADVDVLFTVPTLRGGEQAGRTIFINASSIPVLQEKPISPFVDATKRTSAASPSEEPAPSFTTRVGRASHTILEVPASLSAYTTPDTVTSLPLQQWNYTLASSRVTPAPPQRLPGNTGDKAPEMRGGNRVTEPYAFAGGYGVNLLEEVDRYAQVAVEIAKSHTFDVVHAHDWMTYPAGIAASKVSGKPLVVHIHATEIDRSGTHVNPDVFKIEKKAMEIADKVIAVSHWTKNIAVKYYGISASKVTVVHNGVTPRSGKQSSSMSVPLGVPIVTFLGRITRQKGPMFFVEAAKRVHEKLPEVHFVVAGSGDQLPDMIEMIAQAKLSAYFHFTGFLRGTDVDRVWAMSKVYVMPSVSEPFGIAPLEAIQAGVPVIVSKQAGVAEVMPHAIKVDFWNTEALADAICSLVRFQSLANTLKINGVDHIKKITWDKAAQKLTTLYNELSTKHERKERPGHVLSGPSAKKVTTVPFF